MLSLMQLVRSIPWGLLDKPTSAETLTNEMGERLPRIIYINSFLPLHQLGNLVKFFREVVSKRMVLPIPAMIWNMLPYLEGLSQHSRSHGVPTLMMNVHRNNNSNLRSFKRYGHQYIYRFPTTVLPRCESP